ncbi:hypothetical protein DFH07DRAFT_974408 [Mycena maculata]|uniref:Uncharacterized protein n=1 Tax=Mycena maculata TaxID=230809 RepID=A0AAD7H8Q7_9AGAR|nr:hypothetical protein DFH07DRAFT_974408 [Mycena maculata]
MPSSSFSQTVDLTTFQLKAFQASFPLSAGTAPRPTLDTSAGERTPVELTAHQVKVLRHKDRNEKARIRMAEKRAALKKRPEEDQEAYAQRQRAYRAAYREKLFIEKFGRQAFLAKRRTRFKKRVEQELKAGVRVLRYANVDEEVEDIMEGDSDFETALAQ